MMLTFLKKPDKRLPVNPRVRAYGKARIDIASRARNSADWDRLWKRPLNPFPFAWDDLWNQCIEYRVDDFAAEVGFFIDMLGFSVNAFDPDYAMFTSPLGEFYFSVTPARDGEKSTPPDSFRLQFLIREILQTAEELRRRGIVFETWPQPCTPGSSLYIGTFRSPHGIAIDLWGFVAEKVDSTRVSPSQSKQSEEIAYRASDIYAEASGLRQGNASDRSIADKDYGDFAQGFARKEFKNEAGSIESKYNAKDGG